MSPVLCNAGDWNIFVSYAHMTGTEKRLVEKIGLFESSFDFLVGHDVLQRDDDFPGCSEVVEVLCKRTGTENEIIVAGSALSLGNRAVTKLSRLDIVFLHDLFDRIFHH